MLYDASMIDRRRFWMRSIIFEISIGNAGNVQFGHSQCFENERDKEGILLLFDQRKWLPLVKTCTYIRRVYQRTRSLPNFSLINTLDEFARGRARIVAPCKSRLIPEAGKQTADRRPEFESQTVPRYTGTLDGKYNYVPLGSRKPCLHVKSWWPNLEWRMHNSNYLTFVANFLVRIDYAN